jgi:hypothetical protein
MQGIAASSQERKGVRGYSEQEEGRQEEGEEEREEVTPFLEYRLARGDVSHPSIIFSRRAKAAGS